MRYGKMLLPLCLVWSPPAAAQGPRYSDAAGRRAVERMVAAHGGLDRWRSAATLRYDNVFYNPGAGAGANPWWVSRETFDLRDRQTYHDWPLDGARLAFDGERVWSTGWRQPNPPAFMAFFFYYFVNLPWLTQDSTARIGPLGPAELPGFEGAYDTVRVTWAPPYPVGRTLHDYFVLFIERTTGLLRAYWYGIGYGTMLDLMQLPADRVSFGPMLRIHDSFVTVGGLTFPTRMHTGNTDGTRVFGHHAIFNYSLSDQWRNERVLAPPGAVTDTSSTMRAGMPPPR